MRIRVSHQTVYEFDQPAKALIQTLRLTPRNHDGQHVVRWRIDVDVDGRLRQGEDAFANITHALDVPGPVSRCVVAVEGEVETHDTAGVVRGSVERFPDTLFLRETDPTRADPAVRSLAEEAAREAGEDPLSRMHALMARLHTAMAFAPDAAAAPDAGTALASACGCGIDLAHVFVAAARHLGVPARFVSGYACPDVPDGDGGLHAWGEAHVPGIGWIGFDAVRDICPMGGHVRIAVGLDYWGAAPVRGTRYGGSGERRAETLRVVPRDQAASQAQA